MVPTLVPLATGGESLLGDIYGVLTTGPTSVLILAYYVLVVIAMWRVFTKAGYPGILAIIPIVNIFFLVKVAGLSAWFALLYLIPLVNVVFAIVVAFRIGTRFGKGGAFSFFLLWLFPVIGYFIVGFGQAQYRRQ